MARMGRPGMSRAQKRDLWRRWKGGQSLSDIARFFDKNPGSIFGVLAAQGGIAPRERSPIRPVAELNGPRRDISMPSFWPVVSPDCAQPRAAYLDD
jgi:hypothetical protein